MLSGYNQAIAFQVIDYRTIVSYNIRICGRNLMLLNKIFTIVVMLSLVCSLLTFIDAYACFFLCFTLL